MKKNADKKFYDTENESSFQNIDTKQKGKEPCIFLIKDNTKYFDKSSLQKVQNKHSTSKKVD